MPHKHHIVRTQFVLSLTYFKRKVCCLLFLCCLFQQIIYDKHTKVLFFFPNLFPVCHSEAQSSRGSHFVSLFLFQSALTFKPRPAFTCFLSFPPFCISVFLLSVRHWQLIDLPRHFLSVPRRPFLSALLTLFSGPLMMIFFFSLLYFLGRDLCFCVAWNFCNRQLSDCSICRCLSSQGYGSFSFKW